MQTPRSSLRTLAFGAAAALFLAPYAADSGTCTADPAARDLLAAATMDGYLNGSGGEDLDFLYRESGFPNLVFLFDSSKQMRLLPPAGPADLRRPAPDLSTAPTLPPGTLIATVTDAASDAAHDDTTRPVGCGLATDVNQAGIRASDMFLAAEARRFHSPCGQTTSVLENQPYKPSSATVPTYPAAMGACPYYTSSNSFATGDPGFDPDYYGRSNVPEYFTPDLVYHDVANVASTLDYVNNDFGHNFGDGWTDTVVEPFRTGNAASSVGTVAQFCAKQGSTAQEAACNACLTTKGWYYDGVLLRDGAGRTYPSVWYTGNYLSFFPPKFLIARKVVKDLVAQMARVRMAVARFDATTGGVVGEDFTPVCTAQENANWSESRGSIVSALNNSGKTPFTLDISPLSAGLLAVGRHYLSWNLPWWGATRSPSNYNEQQAAVCAVCQSSNVILLAGGLPSADEGFVAPLLPTGSTTTAQATSGIYAGDSSTGITGITSPSCPTPLCSSFSGTEDYLNNLPRVAWYLQNMDFRYNTETPANCAPMGGVQRIQTFTVGFGTSQSPQAATILSNAAEAGGGIFVAAENPYDLRQGLENVLQEISTRSTSFSVATISTLQTTSGRAVIVPRFDPNKTAHWPGHLFRFDLYSEFVNICTPNGTGDLDCDGKCTSTFLQDQPGTADTPLSDASISLVSEDAVGAFIRNDPPGKPLCTQATACASANCAIVGNAAAVPFWDAGQKLAEKSWRTRKVFTVTDDNRDGRIDRVDPTFELMDSGGTAVSTTAATKLVPYLGLGGIGTGGSVCDTLANKLTTAGDSASAGRVGTDRVECAKTILRYVLGADVLNEMGKTAAEGWPKANQDELWDRPYKLGDIFHSSPQVVDPPLPRQGVLCPAGLSVQCIPSLWETPTAGGPAGYDLYAGDRAMTDAQKAQTYYNRDKFILVGANDGLLHAFHAGEWKANEDDAYTSAVDESLSPFFGHFDRGTAQELWAFLPPDLIAKIPALMGTTHKYFVDGTAMVRDVWVDDTDNGLRPGGVVPVAGADDVKQANEFHTVAVVGERRGGTRFFALDVTNADEVTYTNPIVGTPALVKAPKFLWIYPQPNDPESLTFGETYDDYLPAPPPIGPVRVHATTASQTSNTLTVNVPNPSDPTSTTAVPYHERWIAFLNGGFDPQYVRGRGVHMVDVWTGRELFDFSFPSDGSAVAADDPRRNLKFPVPGVVGMSGWGLDAIRRESQPTHDFFFDTATFSDAGGQLWALRFFAPAERDANGRATNWFGGRVFQMGDLSHPCDLCAGQPIFVITGDASVSPPGVLDRVYRTFFGTGDRFNLLDPRGGTCGPDNIRACVQRGCTVTVAGADNFLQTIGAGSATAGLGQNACATTSSASLGQGSHSSCTVGGKAKISIINCPGLSSTLLSTTKEKGGACVEESDGHYRCSPSFVAEGGKPAIDPVDHPISVGNWFFSLLVWEKNTDRDLFWDLEGAKRYDAARTWVNQNGMGLANASTGSATFPLVISSATNVAAASTSTGDWANASSKGWALFYNHDGTVTVPTDTSTSFTVDWRDERTSAGAAFGPNAIVTWRTTLNPLSVTSTSEYTGNSCKKCTTEAKRLAYHYNANALTGAPVFFDTSGTAYRSKVSYLQVPAQADQRTVFINREGQVAVGLTSVSPETGASTVGMSDPVDPTQDAGFLEVSQQAHECRHTDVDLSDTTDLEARLRAKDDSCR